MGRLHELCSDPRFWRRVHFWLTIAWIVALIPSLLWWKDSLVWVNFMSVWAGISGHFASFQASREAGQIGWAKVHGIAVIFWAFLMIPTLLWWGDSVVWLVFMSLWANVTGHFAAYQSSCSEEKG